MGSNFVLPTSVLSIAKTDTFTAYTKLGTNMIPDASEELRITKVRYKHCYKQT